jgi:hypothetical protein
VDKTEKKEAQKPEAEKKPTCGIVMPISAIEDCNAAHWQEVKGIIEEAADKAGFTAKIVSESDDVGVIQSKIIQNLFDSDIVVCDVSAKNANVMFELGLRLAFDKPAIVLKDDKTSYSFDTSPLEHLDYPRDLHYPSIIKFKEALAKKIVATFKKSKEEGYKSFLDNFGTFAIKGLGTTEVSKEEFVLQKLDDLQSEMASLSRRLPVQAENDLLGKLSQNALRANSPDLSKIFKNKNELIGYALTKALSKGERRGDRTRVFEDLDPQERHILYNDVRVGLNEMGARNHISDTDIENYLDAQVRSIHS